MCVCVCVCTGVHYTGDLKGAGCFLFIWYRTPINPQLTAARPLSILLATLPIATEASSHSSFPSFHFLRGLTGKKYTSRVNALPFPLDTRTHIHLSVPIIKSQGVLYFLIHFSFPAFKSE